MTTNLQRYNMRSRYTTANVITRLIKLKDLHTCAKTVNSLCYAALYKRPCHMHAYIWQFYKTTCTEQWVVCSSL